MLFRAERRFRFLKSALPEKGRTFMFRNIKGAPGYISKHKKLEVLKLLAAFALIAGLIVIGMVTTGSKKNLLTVVAVLGCLPACRVMASLIAIWPYHSLDAASCARIRESADTVRVFFDFVFTSQEAIYPVCSIAICGHTVCGYMKEKTKLLSGAEEHLKKAVRAEGIQKVSVKIFDNEEAYRKRLIEMRALDTADEGKSDGIELQMANLFMNFSL